MHRSKISILMFVPLVFAVAPLVHADGATKEKLEAWVGNPAGQTIDAVHSFVVVVCDATGTVEVVGHVHKTNQSDQTLQVAVKEDGGSPFVVSDVSFVPNNQGNGNFYFNLDSFAPGLHDLVVEVQNLGFSGVNLYFNESANNGSAYPGVPFVCP